MIITELKVFVVHKCEVIQSLKDFTFVDKPCQEILVTHVPLKVNIIYFVRWCKLSKFLPNCIKPLYFDRPSRVLGSVLGGRGRRYLFLCMNVDWTHKINVEFLQAFLQWLRLMFQGASN